MKKSLENGYPRLPHQNKYYGYLNNNSLFVRFKIVNLKFICKYTQGQKFYHISYIALDGQSLRVIPENSFDWTFLKVVPAKVYSFIKTFPTYK